MAKGPGGNINTGNAIVGQQLGVSSTAGQRSADDYSQFKDALAPLIGQQKALASGDRQASLTAAMPWISKLSQGFTGAKESLMNSMPPGAARDRALADLQTQMSTGIAGAQANAVQQAPQTLAGLAPNFSQMSLQELGAMLGGLQGGAQTNQGVGQMAAAQQKALLDFFGGLVKTGTGLVSGGLLGGGGGGSSPFAWGSGGASPGGVFNLPTSPATYNPFG